MLVENHGIDKALFSYITESVHQTPYYRLLGVQVKSLGPGWAEIHVALSHEHTNPLGLIHGGVIMSAADAAMGNAIRSLGIKGVTVDCSTSFLSTAKLGEPLVARGTVVKAGQKLVFARCEVFSRERIIADVKSTFAHMGEIDPLREGRSHHQ